MTANTMAVNPESQRLQASECGADSLVVALARLALFLLDIPNDTYTPGQLQTCR
jgi:hypothetical protein